MTNAQPTWSAQAAMAATADSPGAVPRDLRGPALTAGIGLLVLAVLAGAANFAAVQRLVTPGDATRTANDILASAGSFRLGTAALVAVALLDVVVAWALRMFFAPVNAHLATLAAWLRLSYAAIFAVAISQLAGALPLLRNAPYVTTLGADQRRAEALLKIQSYEDIWHAGLALFGLHLVLIGYLAYRSGYVPRWLGVLLAVAGVGYLIDTFAELLMTDYSISVSAVTFIGEALFLLWLLVKGRTIVLDAPRGLIDRVPTSAP
jgi:hypothetical protein